MRMCLAVIKMRKNEEENDEGYSYDACKKSTQHGSLAGQGKTKKLACNNLFEPVQYKLVAARCMNIP